MTTWYVFKQEDDSIGTMLSSNKRINIIYWIYIVGKIHPIASENNMKIIKQT